MPKEIEKSLNLEFDKVLALKLVKLYPWQTKAVFLI
jgi:hypothetical protein